MVLEQPAEQFLMCFIGSKVDQIKAALTFLRDNLQINILCVNESVLVLSSDEVNAATQPIAAAAVGNNNDPNGGLLGHSAMHTLGADDSSDRKMIPK